MKKVLFVLSLILISFSSCKKDEVVLTYTQDKLNGTWENIVKTDGVTDQMIITSNSISEKSISANGTSTIDYTNYSFDGTKITYTFLFVIDELTINELTDTKLVVTSKLAEEKIEYKKVK